MKTSKGFTLIELMITVAVVAVLASIAYPSYTAYLIRGKLAEGASALSDGRVKIEQFFQDNRTYIGAPKPANTANFTFAVTNPGTPPNDKNTYTLTATGIGALAGFVYTIDQNNAKITTAAPDGWRAGTMPAACWITKKNGVC